MKKIRSNFVWVCSGRINLNESMWEMPKSCCVKNESHQNSVKMWKLFSYFVYNTPWNPLFCDLQTVSINLMGHMYLATHFCSVRGLENESNGKWPIFWCLNIGVDPYRAALRMELRRSWILNEVQISGIYNWFETKHFDSTSWIYDASVELPLFVSCYIVALVDGCPESVSI